MSLHFHEAPIWTEWGRGMVGLDYELSRDETVTIYLHKDAIPLLKPALIKLIEELDDNPD